MNARRWKRAAGVLYKKKQKARNTFRTFYRQYPFQGFTEERLSESSVYLPVPISGFIIRDTGMSLLLQGLLLPLVAHQNYNFGKYKVVDSVAVRFLRTVYSLAKSI